MLSAGINDMWRRSDIVTYKIIYFLCENISHWDLKVGMGWDEKSFRIPITNLTLTINTAFRLRHSIATGTYRHFIFYLIILSQSQLTPQLHYVHRAWPCWFCAGGTCFYRRRWLYLDRLPEHRANHYDRYSQVMQCIWLATITNSGNSKNAA